MQDWISAAVAQVQADALGVQVRAADEEPTGLVDPLMGSMLKSGAVSTTNPGGGLVTAQKQDWDDEQTRLDRYGDFGDIETRDVYKSSDSNETSTEKKKTLFDLGGKLKESKLGQTLKNSRLGQKIGNRFAPEEEEPEDFDDLMEELERKKRRTRGQVEDEERQEADEERRGNRSAKKMLKGAFGAHSIHMGPLGDEMGIDVDNYRRDRGEENWGTGAGSESMSYVGEDGTTHKELSAAARAGVSVGGNTSNRTTTADGFEETGAGGSAWAGTQANARRETYSGNGLVGTRVSADVSAGAGAEGGVAAKKHANLGWGKGVLEAGANGSAFAGVRANGSAEAKASWAGGAEANAQAGVFAGVEASGEMQGQAALKVGDTDLFAARGKASGTAYAGAGAQASGTAKASFAEGVTAKGEARADAGAKAEGEFSAGVTAGFVDADVVGEGEAFAGAEADASGEVSIGPAGAKLEGEVGAFAGAKAEGEIGMEIGGGGLNLGRVMVKGSVQAGAGAHAGGSLTAKDGKISAGAEAGAAVGVGAGLGMTFKGDLAFAPRLILDQLKKNDISLGSVVGKVATDAKNWVLKKDGGDPVKVAAAVAGSSDGARCGLMGGAMGGAVGGAAGGAGGPGGMAGLAVAAAPAGLGSFDAMEGGSDLADSRTPGEALETLSGQDAQQMSEGVEGANLLVNSAVDDAVATTNASVRGGMGILDKIGPALLKGFSAAEGAHTEALAGIQDLITSAISESDAMGKTLMSVGSTALAELRGLISLNPAKLLTMDWEAEIDGIIAGVHSMVAQIKQGILDIINQTQKTVTTMGLKLGKTIAAPIRIAANGVGAIVGDFGKVLTSAGFDTIRSLTAAFGAAEAGIPVPGLGASLVLPHAVTPKIAQAGSVMGQADSFFAGAAGGSFGEVVDDMAEDLSRALFEDAPEMVADLGRDVLTGFEQVEKTVLEPIEGVVRQVTTVVAPAVEAAQAVAREAKKVVDTVGNGIAEGAKAVGGAISNFFAGW